MSGPVVNVPDGLQVYVDQEQGTRQIRNAKTGELLREITDAELVAANRNYLQRAIDAEAEKMNPPWQPPSGGLNMPEPTPRENGAGGAFGGLFWSLAAFGFAVVLMHGFSGWAWTDCVAWTAAAWVVLLNASLAITKKRHGL